MISQNRALHYDLDHKGKMNQGNTYLQGDFSEGKKALP
jgi:hypothetical protein